MTAAEVSTPSTERSIEPIRMMKVAPIPSTSGIIAAWLILTALPKLRKFGLIAATMAQSATSTASGAQAASRQRRAGAALPSARTPARRACCQFRDLSAAAPPERARGERPRAPCPRLAVLDLPAGAAPDVVPVDLRLLLDVLVVEGLRILGGDRNAGAVELPMILRLLRRVEGAGLGMIANRQPHAALPERIPGHGARHLAGEDRFDGQLDSVDPGDRHLAGAAVRAERLDRGERHVVVGGPDAADFVTVLGQPGIGLLQRLGRQPVRHLHVEQLDVGVRLDRLHQTGLALDRRNVRLGAADAPRCRLCRPSP